MRRALATLQVLGLIKDYAVQWRPPFLIASMSYFDILNVGVEMTAPACGANNVRPHAALVGCASHRRGILSPPGGLLRGVHYHHAAACGRRPPLLHALVRRW